MSTAGARYLAAEKQEQEQEYTPEPPIKTTAPLYELAAHHDGVQPADWLRVFKMAWEGEL